MDTSKKQQLLIIAVYFFVIGSLLFLLGCKPKEEVEVIKPPVVNEEVIVEEVIVVEEPIEEVVEEVVEAPPVVHYKGPFKRDYDEHFQKWSKVYLPFLDWIWLKSQCYQESLLKYDAVSPVGAMGLCQFMPGTWREVSGKINIPDEATAFDPSFSIQAAAYYDGMLWRQWSSPRPVEDRLFLVFASYNAGLGNILKAQKACDNKSLYEEIMECLPQITGHHHKETVTYVVRIERWYKQMLFE